MFYDVFEKLCRENGVSLAQVRKDLSISQSTMASWKSRNLTPKSDTLQRLAEYFNVSVGYLLGEEREQVVIPGRLSIIETNQEDLKNIRYTIKAADQEAYELGLKIFADAGVDLIKALPKTRLDAAFEKLNAEGQQKAVERVEELVEIPRYQRPTESATVPVEGAEGKD